MVCEISVTGLVTAAGFQQARLLAETLEMRHRRDIECKVVPMTELDWETHMRTAQRMYPDAASVVREESTIIVVDGSVVTSAAAFANWAKSTHEISIDDRSTPLYQAVGLEQQQEIRKASGHEFVFFDVSIADEPAGRLVFELFTDVAPVACRNFRLLCNGSVASSIRDGVGSLTYAGSLFHRVQPQGWLQGGDIVGSSGDKGESALEGGAPFADETFVKKHAKRGVLSMANSGLHTNQSQFFITFRALDFLDNSCVAFGELVEGASLFRRLEGIETFNQRPVEDCVITACGEL